ncbi:MAG TPA: efflux transporter outer membrane subunit [Candidatus Limnocylindrales bacterium]|nr:efflux transporter outer membrane subunit [Candidatus Limnocylindrales bacterium]
MKLLQAMVWNYDAGRTGGLVLFLAALFSLNGCAVGPKYKTPTTLTPPTYKELGSWKTAEPSDQNLGGNWWEIFNDLQLNVLEQQINVSNQNLKAAVAQYQQARATLRYNRADYYPTLTADPTAIREKFSENRPASSTAIRGVTFSEFTVPLNLSYQVNAWGRVSRNVEFYREQAQASAADLAVVNLSMHADLAVDYFAARTLDAEEKLLQNTVAQYEQALQLNEERYRGGLASEVEVEQARTILETTRAQLIDVGVARAQYEHAVAVLIGKPPADFSLPPLPITAPPPRIPVGVPSELLERRPDIAAAERRVASANAQIGLAKLAYYPVINLVASGGFDSAGLGTLFQGPSAIWAIGASAAQTIFDGGRRRAISDEAKAGYDYSVANYRETTLAAFQQVEDNLASLRILENEATVQATAVDAAKRSLALSETRYEGGVTSYLEVITAQNAALTNEVTAVNILGRQMASAVLLIEALGGGWDRANIPQHPECCRKQTSTSD